MTVYLMCFAFFLVGVYGVLTKRDMIKIILSIGIMSYAVNLFFILFAYKDGGTFPILQQGVIDQVMVDPLPQALVLTAIVIELGTTALLVALALKIFQHYNTFDITKIKRLSG